MPLILTANHPFSQIHFKPSTIFEEGQLGQHCDLELSLDTSKIQEKSGYISIKSYVGNYFEGVFHGKGELTFTNGDQYTGMFKFGRKEGKGVYKRMETGDEYDSEWQEDLLHGKCKIKLGADKKQGYINLGYFDKGLNQFTGKTTQKAVISSFLSSEYDYTPPVFEEDSLSGSIEFEYLRFDVEQMIEKAFQNKNQKQGEKAYYDTGYIYQRFNIKKRRFGTHSHLDFNLMNQFVELHDIVLPSVFPTGYIHNKKFFDLENCIFYGPYSNGTGYQIELCQPDKPKFCICWSSESNLLQIGFYNSYDEQQYFIQINQNIIGLYNWTTCKPIFEYNITPNGKLAQKTVYS